MEDSFGSTLQHNKEEFKSARPAYPWYGNDAIHFGTFWPSKNQLWQSNGRTS